MPMCQISKCDIFMCEWKMNFNLSYLNVIQMLKVHKA